MEWYRRILPSWTDGHARTIISRLERDVFPWIGNQKINEIAAPDVLRTLRRVESRGAIESAHRIKTIIGQVFRYAIATGLADRDPAADLKGALPAVQPKNMAALTEPPEFAHLFYAWLTELENEIRGEDIHPAMESHLAKYRSLIPSLALICHLADEVEFDPMSPVSTAALQQALKWYKYLRSHAERIYGMIIHGHTAGAKNILEKIAKGLLTNPFKRRDIQRGCWAGLTEPEDIDGALSVLEDYGYIRSVNQRPGHLGGRPTIEYHIHPKFRSKPRS